MNTKIPVFVDSDVVISSLISERGAAHLLIQDHNLLRFISSIGIREQIEVVKRLSLSLKKYHQLIDNSFQKIELESSQSHSFERFVADKNDAHIVQGAIGGSARFLITYNTKHFKIDSIKKTFNLIVLTPGVALQYLRSR